MSKLPVFELDDAESADWTKATWDLPPYGSPQFFAAIGGEDQLVEFKKGAAYAAAIEQGLIFDDEWMADWIEVPHEAGEDK